MSRREIIPPTREEVPGLAEKTNVEETHPAWGLIGASRVSTGPGGTSLFDSDILHQHTVVVRLGTASRKRDLNRDWIHKEQDFVEVEMSEAQWASFVSSMNSGDGVPCTIRRREDDVHVPGMPHEPRLHQSITEVREAADRAFRPVQEAFDAYAEKQTAANLKALKFAIANAPSNIAFSADSLTEHAENVVQRARADIEAVVASKARQLGVGEEELGGVAQLGPATGEEKPS